MTAGVRLSLRVTCRWPTRGACHARMGQGGRQMVAAKLRQHHRTRSAASVAQSAARHMTAGARRSLRVTRRGRSAGRMPCLHGAGRQPEADGGSEANLALLLPTVGHCTRSAASVAQSAASHVTAVARRSLHVTRRWRSAGRMPCLHGAGFQAGGGSEAMSASLHTVCCQRSAAERGPPHGGRREEVNALCI